MSLSFGNMWEILLNWFLQLLFTVGFIILFGLAIWGQSRLFYLLVRRHARFACYLTGFIGTPVHEVGHAFFCLIFGHKVTAIKLYQLNDADGVMGFVMHTYNKKNVYHQIGNFFIGIGPILFGSGALLLLMLIFVPDLFGGLTQAMDFSSSSVGHVFVVLWNILTTFFSVSSLTNPMWWVFMLPACSVSLHMNVSIPDIKTSLIGLGFISGIMLVVNIILHFFKGGWALTKFSLSASVFILNFLIISIFLLVLLVSILGIMKGIGKGVKTLIARRTR